jgi:hypothetical protein
VGIFLPPDAAGFEATPAVVSDHFCLESQHRVSCASGATAKMDSSAFDAIKNSAITLVSQKLETQREVERLRGDVAAAYDQIKTSRTTINRAYEQGSEAFFDWQDLARKRTAAQNNSLMLLNKANTMWELAKMPSGGRVSKENLPTPALTAVASTNVIDFTHASVDAIEKEVQVRIDQQLSDASLWLNHRTSVTAITNPWRPARHRAGIRTLSAGRDALRQGAPADDAAG